MSNSRILMVVPTLGRRLEFLRQTLESIANQQNISCDVILVCPSDNTKLAEMAADFRAKVVDDPGGLSAAINKGFSKAKKNHDYLAWIGDDDLLKSDSLQTTVEALDESPRAAAAYGYCDYIDEKGNVLFTSRAGRFAPWIMTWGPDLIPQPGTLFRKSALEMVGPLDASLNFAMDLDIFLRLRKAGKLLNTKKTVACFRWHDTSITVSNRSASLDEAEMVKRRYLSKPLRAIAPLWESLVRVATKLAVKRVNRLAMSYK